jgi:phosphotransferase system enzyme I (PtsI)
MIMKKTNVLKGIATAPGITIAKAFLYRKEIESISSEEINDIAEAQISLKEAIEKSKKELGKIFELAVKKLGEKRAAIFEAQMMILEDNILIDTLLNRIDKEKKAPEYIVHDEITKYQNLMNASTEFYMKERSQDIEDIKNRIIRNLKNKKWKSKIDNDVIVVSENVTPADTVLFTRANVKGYITNFGGITSHAAILARSLRIPAVLGVHEATAKIEDNDLIILDGYHGEIIINPTEKQVEYYQDKIERLATFDTELLTLRDEPAVTIDGQKYIIQANLDVNEEIEFVIQNGAHGIGLVRTEQLYNVLENFPDEETQFKEYCDLANKLYPHSVTIRAFDIGGDKVLPLDLKEPNPMLGWRGIRFLLDHQNLFKTQIKAILRASVNQNVKFMIPMVSSIAEVNKTKMLIDECKKELEEKGLKFNPNMEFGIMIEVPSAALMIRDFGKCVSFFSVGTNDLIQYLLAVDRGNEIVSSSYQEFHPAVIRALEFMVHEAKITNTPMNICGEMAADHYAVPIIIGLGFHALSVNASEIPYIKKIINNLSFKECRVLVKECLKLTTEDEIKSRILKFYKERFTEFVDKIFENNNR